MAVSVKEGICPHFYLESTLKPDEPYFKTKQMVSGDCPTELAQRIAANRGSWPFHELVGIEFAPTLRRDGSLVDKPGYDEATGLLFKDEYRDKWPFIPAKPSDEHVRRALICLWEPFLHFPFVNPVDRAVALAAMLTAVIRRILPTAPGFAVNAHQMGTGKTKLAQCIGILASGRTPAVAPWSENTEEQRKSLMASLLSASAALLLDNIEKPLSSAELCAILTGDS